MIASLRHIGIVTCNIQKSIDFYSDNFDFKVTSDQNESGNFISTILGRKTAVRTVKMTNGCFTLEFLNFENHNNENFDIFTLGCTHFALTVNSAHSVYNDLIAKNVFFISEPKVSKDKKVIVCFLKDPYNNIFIEIVEELNK